MDSTEGDGLFTGLGGANYQDFRENSRASENGTNSYAAVAGRLPQRNGRQPPPRRPQAPPVAAPMPTHITRTRTLLIDVKAVKPNHDRAERAALLIEDMQLPAATVTDIYMLQVEQLLLVTFSSEVVFQEAMEMLKVGVRWTAAWSTAGRLLIPSFKLGSQTSTLRCLWIWWWPSCRAMAGLSKPGLSRAVTLPFRRPTLAFSSLRWPSMMMLPSLILLL